MKAGADSFTNLSSSIHLRTGFFSCGVESREKGKGRKIGREGEGRGSWDEMRLILFSNIISGGEADTIIFLFGRKFLSQQKYVVEFAETTNQFE